jgi:hypothetical protein
MTRAAAALATAALAAALVSGCESTQEQSARIARSLGHQSARTGTTKIGAESRSVRVVKAVVVPGNPAAVALELANSGAAAATAIPVLVAVRDAKGTVVYRNDTKGIEASIQRLALLGAHATVWWVDNQVLASGGGLPTRVSARVGVGNGAPRAAAAGGAGGAGGAGALSVRGVEASNSFPGPHVDVTVHNGGSAAQSQIAVYAVAISGSRVVGAGLALIASLPGAASTPAEIPMTGTVSGAKIATTAVGGSG